MRSSLRFLPLVIAATAVPEAAHGQVEASLPRSSALWKAHGQELSRVDCSGPGCTAWRLVVAEAPSERCHSDFLPTDRFKMRSGPAFWGLETTLWLRRAGDGQVYRVPATIRLDSEAVHDVCIPAELSAGEESFEVEPPREAKLVGDRKDLAGRDIVLTPATGDAGVFLFDGTRASGLGGYFALKGRNIIDFIFGRSSNSLVRVRVDSRPVGSAVFLGPRRVATTSAEFLVAQRRVFDLTIGFGRERRFLRDCQQQAEHDSGLGGNLVRILCVFDRRQGVAGKAP